VGTSWDSDREEINALDYSKGRLPDGPIKEEEGEEEEEESG
jgi:hypothetical protein